MTFWSKAGRIEKPLGCPTGVSKRRFTIKKYEVPIEKLPESLQGKVKKQYLLEYESEAKTIQYQGKTIEIAPFKAYEHVYEE